MTNTILEERPQVANILKTMSNIQHLTQDRREKFNPYPLCFYS